MAVINELGGEKIDVILWQEDPEKFIANALSPAKIEGVKIEDKNTAVVFVGEDQLSLAIGKEGRNVRLAANLTGWKIDVKPAVKKETKTPGNRVIYFYQALSNTILGVAILIFIVDVVAFINSRQFSNGLFGMLLVAVVLFIISYLLRFRKGGK